MSSRPGGDEPARELLRGLIVLRVVIISTLTLSALLIQVTFFSSLGAELNSLYYAAAFAFALSAFAAATLRRLSNETNAILQILGDLAVVTFLVQFSGGPESSFTFLYMGVVAAGAFLLDRRGGLVVAGLATVFYAVLVYLSYRGSLPPPDLAAFGVTPQAPKAAALLQNVAVNAAAFLATAFLVSSSAEKLRDVRTTLRRRNAEIARLQALHSAVLASMSSGLVTTDLDGTITYVNRAAPELLGRTAGELLGKPVLSLGLLEERAWAALGESSEIVRAEGNRTVRGPDFYFGVSAAPLKDGEGTTIGRILIFQNLTELKKLEGEVRLKEKLAAVGELAAGIAHEIRNPLASISGSVQVLRGAAVPGSSDRRLMDIVVNESQRLSSILEDFLRYVRPRERAVESVDAPAALRDVLTLLRHSEETTPLHRIELDVPPEPFAIAADPGQLRQIFWNVARNAIAAMPSGGTLRVSTAVEGRFWFAILRDEGRGMTPEERDRLFTPFAHSFRDGTGLGLAIVYRIVEEHGGTIRVDTAPGRGTTIAIGLPLEASAFARAREVA